MKEERTFSGEVKKMIDDAAENVFKVPKLPPPLNKKNEDKSKSEKETEESNVLEVEDEKSDGPLSEESYPSRTTVSVRPIPYCEPSWGGLPDKFYSLEELKAGVSLRNIQLDRRSFYCFGRLDNCHVVMAHPTISRYHAVLQFRSTFSDTDERKGFYLYDMGSTHGTFLNKERVAPKTYVKVQVGHMIKFGGSTRFFLLHGPDDDQEEESKYSYSQLCELRRQELEKRQNAYLEDIAKMMQGNTEEETKGIDWGMGEDADEESDLTVNPFALTNNEELYVDDPKKMLRSWFDREGEELNYNVDEKGFGQFRCTVELPIASSSGSNVLAEASVSGKKKEAIVQCALEACRILDRYGLLKQSNQEAKKRKLKNWEEDDYYDSDEDNFFDRTGDLDEKRKKRMVQVNKESSAPDTYDTLVLKHSKVIEEINDIKQKLDQMLSSAGSCDDNTDSYMNFDKNQPIDKLELRRYKTMLSNLQTEENRLQKLVNFTKPFELPQVNHQQKVEDKVSENTSATDNGKKEEVKIETIKIDKITKNDYNERSSDSSSKSNNIAKVHNNKKNMDSNSAIIETFKKPNTISAKKKTSITEQQLEDDYNNTVWTPPVGQTGDGRTSLNDKFGY